MDALAPLIFEIPAPKEANSIQEFQMESGARNNGLLVPVTFQSLKTGTAAGDELRKAGTR
jgi:hypothetical protein